MRAFSIRSRRLVLTLAASAALPTSLLGATAGGEAKTPEMAPPVERTVDFQTDVLPIFEASCFKCHGPAMAMGGLRLHTRSDLLAGGDKGTTVLEGNSAGSRLIQLVAGVDELKMPLDGEPLTPEQVGVLRAWIDQGVIWPQGPAVSNRRTPDETSETSASSAGHWAFEPVRQDPPPRVADSDWVRNDIDAFVLQRLRSEGLEPSPEADRSTLIRRLHLDLLGLPPTPAQRERFLSDRRPYAYERLLNRVLSSPHFGERWARHWLDLARYADSDGFEKDNVRPHAWRYREWVIDAYNRDLPFDQFVLEQLAGDLLPGATVEQKTATGFHRNTLTNTEGGVDPEEYRVEQVVDRTDTTGLVFMGLTVGCARCHSHKYDPISHREYYQFFSFFNTGIEKNIPAPLPREQVAYRLASQQWEREHGKLLAALEEQRSELKEKLEGAQAVALWEKGLDHSPVEWIPLDLSGYVAAGGAEFSEDETGALLVSGNNPKKDRYTLVANVELRGINAIRLDFPTHESLPSGGPGRSPEGNFVLSELKLGDARLSDPVKPTEVPVERVVAGYSQKGFEIEKAVDGDPKTGWSVNGPLGPNRDQQAVFVTTQSLGRYGGSSLTLTLEQLHGESHNIGSLKAYVTQAPRKDLKQVFPLPVERALAVPAGERSPQQQSAVLDFYVDLDPSVGNRLAALEGHRRARPRPPGTMAQTLARNPDPPRTHIHMRGDFLSPGEEVWPDTLSVLPPLEPRGKDPDRLDLALWLTDPSHPLTARVEVNRCWEHLFGQGLVATSEDFGTRGEKPSHPRLLDWLAKEFVAGGWSRKELVRSIVTSATYRQSSHIRPELMERDPKNLLLARQNRFRVESEATRDLYLAVAGLLEPRVGGKSVYPPLPAGMADLGYGGTEWPESSGTGKYRRGLYIFFQRTVPYPMLMTFDSPDSNTSCVRRIRSNTPLQALTLLNGPLFVESARSLGRRILEEAPSGEADRIGYAFRLALARDPSRREVEIVHELLAEHRSAFEREPEAAAEFAGSADGTEATETAAWIAASRMILNLDEFLTRE